MDRLRSTIAITLFALAWASYAGAQLVAQPDAPVIYGHHHLNVTSLERHKRFWVETLGGRVTTLPNGLINIR